MRRFLLIAAVLALAVPLVMPAAAQEKTKDMQLREFVPLYSPKASVGEVEPNDTAATASGPLGATDVGSGGIGTGTDNDYWALNVTAVGQWIFEMGAGPAPALVDSYMYLYGTDGTTQLAYDDDSGPGLLSRIAYTFPTTGTYYVRIRGYNSGYTGNYVLNLTPPLPAPPNDVCATAIDVQDQGLYTWPVDMRGALNDYTMVYGSSCTGYSAAGGDVVYKVTLAVGESMTVTEAPDTFDASLYVITDCANVYPTCVAGSDAGVGGVAETVTWTNNGVGPQLYYIIVDAYSGSGIAQITIGGAVATEATTWGATKVLYR